MINILYLFSWTPIVYVLTCLMMYHKFLSLCSLFIFFFFVPSIFKWPVFRFSNFLFFLLVEDWFGFSLVSFQSSYTLHLYWVCVCVFCFLSRLIVGGTYVQLRVSFRCATCWLDTFVYCSVITSIALANTSIMSHMHHCCVCVWSECSRFSLSTVLKYIIQYFGCSHSALY